MQTEAENLPIGGTRSAANVDFNPPTAKELRQQFPQFEILELVGRGGMGAVYKARQRELDRLVAVKVLPLEVGRDPAFAERFSREAQALARLNHPNIVAVYDSGRAGGLYYFVMEYIDGVNLRQAMQAGHISPEEALAIVPQICDALQYAHDEGVVHRDIKPENVLVDNKGRVKIADFGLVKLLAEGGTGPPDNGLTLTGAHQVMGTPHYMAPEQMTAMQNVDHRADIYALGVVFYELLTGEVPMGRFEPPSKRVQVDVRLDDIVLRTLEREPARRYQRASEVKTDIETLNLKTQGSAMKKKPYSDQMIRESDVESALQEVKVPAIGLMIVGILMCMSAFAPLVAVLGFFRLVEAPSVLENVPDMAPLDAVEERIQSGDAPIGDPHIPPMEFIPETPTSPETDASPEPADPGLDSSKQGLSDTSSASSLEALRC